MNTENTSPEIRVARTDDEIGACFPVMKELRPDLESAEDLVSRVRRQIEEGFRLICVTVAGRPVACAGYRICEMLAHGRFLYVDDLVTLAAERSKGHGDALMDWLVAEARNQDCRSLQLDSGTQRADAHRFYFRRRMAANAFHFWLPLD